MMKLKISAAGFARAGAAIKVPRLGGVAVSPEVRASAKRAQELAVTAGSALMFAVAVGTAGQVTLPTVPERLAADVSSIVSVQRVFLPDVRRVVDEARIRSVVAEGDWFRRNQDALAQHFRDQYVAVHGRRVVESDSDLTELVRRFTKKYKTSIVYFGFVGTEAPGAIL